MNDRKPDTKRCSNGATPAREECNLEVDITVDFFRSVRLTGAGTILELGQASIALKRNAVNCAIFDFQKVA